MPRPVLLVVLVLLAIAPFAIAQVAQRPPPASTAEYDAPRARLISSIRGYAQTIGERDDPRILQAMRDVPRHLFVPVSLRSEAYEDYPLPIGEDQTISQPSLVALMTQLLHPQPGDVMLEVGTGSGFQAALLSRLVKQVYSIEIVEPLARQASERLRRLGHANVEVRHGDGYLGWPEHAPFDGIIVTAGARHVPKPLLDQLKPGGRMVIPVGSTLGGQELRLISKDAKGSVSQRMITYVRFVPLTRKLRR